MSIDKIILSTGLSLLFLVVVFRPLEAAFPAKPGQRFFRPAWFTDLLFFLGQYLLWSGVVFWILTHFSSWFEPLISESFRKSVAAQPWWLQAVEVIVLSDFFVYWGHRLQHKTPFL